MRIGLVLLCLAMSSACTGRPAQVSVDGVALDAAAVDGPPRVGDGRRVDVGREPSTVTRVKALFLIDASYSLVLTDPSPKNSRAVFELAAAGTTSIDDPALVVAWGERCVEMCRDLVGNFGAGKFPPPELPDCDSHCPGPDQPGRVAGVRRALDRLLASPRSEAAIVRFNPWVTVNGGANGCEGFTRDPRCLTAGLDGLTVAYQQADLQSGLATGIRLVRSDIERSAPADRRRTRYVMVVLADGAPSPRCYPGCDNDKLTPVLPIPWCERPRDRWCRNEMYNLDGATCTFFQQAFPSMIEACAAHNDDSALVASIGELVDHGERQGVAAVQVHTGLLRPAGWPAELLSGIDQSPFRPPGILEDAERLLVTMAKAGRGTFEVFDSGQQIDWSHVDLAPP